MIPVAFLLAVVASAGGEVLARVDGTTITAGSLTGRMQADSRLQGARPGDVLDGLVTEAVLAAEARRLNLAGTPEVLASIRLQRRRAAAASFVDREMASRIQPEEKKLVDAFHATADFASFEFLAFETQPAADAAFQRIRKGSSLAAEASGAVTSKLYRKPTDAPAMMRAQLEPPLAAVLFGSAPGSVAGPVRLGDGWAVVHLLSKEIGTEAQFAERRASLAAYVRRRGTEDMVRHVVGQLRAKAGVKIDEPFIRSVASVRPSLEQLDHVIATVDGEPLRYREVFDATASMRGGHGMGPAVLIEAAWKQIDERLLQALAIQRGHDKVPSVASQESDFERVALAAAAVRHAENGVAPPTDGEIKAAYRRNAAARARSFEDARADVAAALAREKRAAAVAALIRRLRTKASVSIDPSALARAARTET